MARGKIVISSATNGGKEIINNKNGFLFEIGSSNELSQIIKKVGLLPKKEKEKIQIQAIKTAQKFKWGELIKYLEDLF